MANSEINKGQQSDFIEYSKNLAQAKSIIVKHPRFKEIYGELEEVHYLSKKMLITEQLCILGPTGAGKTTLVEEYVSNFQRKNEEERTIIPVLHVKVPPRARSPKVLASKILRIMGDPLFDNGTEENMTHRIQNFVRKCGIEMIILDEFQHLIDRDTNHVLATASDWLKTFIEEINIPVVLCGLPESERIFEHNEQLDSRYTNRLYLNPFRYDTKEEKIAFRRFLVTIDEKLPFQNKANLSDPHIASKIFYFSFGLPRYIMDLLRQATKIALNRGHNNLTELDLRDAFERIKRSSRPYAINPFEVQHFDLDKELLSEKKRQGIS